MGFFICPGWKNLQDAGGRKMADFINQAPIILVALLLVVGFVLLIKGADYFVEGASQIAERFRIPQIVIGLTIVAFGTSAPEAAISIAAAAKDSAGIAVGNVLGSNIMNILLILGITACIRKLKVQANTVKVEMPFLILISVVLVVMGLLTERLNFVSGLILWAFFIAFFIKDFPEPGKIATFLIVASSSPIVLAKSIFNLSFTNSI